MREVMRLLDLAPDIQEAVLDGEFHGGGVEKTLRAAATSALWAEQDGSIAHLIR